MTRSQFWYVNCDGCGEEGRGGEGSRGVDNLGAYLASLRTEGWTFGAKDLCAECNGNGPKERARNRSDDSRVD